MSQWPATKAKRVLAALLRIGWKIKRQSGSHRTLSRESDYMIRGEEHPTIRLGEKYSRSELGPLLKSRTELLSKWADDDSVWDDALF
jgi:predicted RNA binding protein YcfA (HicA-like mRNA interferase family)